MKKTGDDPPKIHNLVKLTKLAQIDISEDVSNQLTEMTSWNIEARYDDYKSELYKRANKEFTSKWLVIVKEHIIWLKSLY